MVKYPLEDMPLYIPNIQDTWDDAKINLTKAVWWSNFDKEFDKKTKRANN